MIPLSRRLVCEYLATLLLLVAVVGSGVMGERLAAGNVAVALLANALATAGALYAIIEVFGTVGGAHMNPLVSLALAVQGRFDARDVPAYLAAQFAGAASGTWMAHAMFALPIAQWSTHVRSGPAQWLSELVATAGLVLVVLRVPAARTAAAVAAYIGAAYWFAASTAFANPAAAFGRMLTDTFAGIAPANVPAFAGAELLGAAVGVAVHRFLTTAMPDAGARKGEHVPSA